MLTPSRPLKLRPSWKIGSLFAKMRERNAADEAVAVKAAKELIVDLEACDKAATLCSLLPRLQGLMVTRGLLQKCPSIIGVLAAAAKRCRKTKYEPVACLLSSWRQTSKQQEEDQPQGLDKRPSAKDKVNQREAAA